MLPSHSGFSRTRATSSACHEPGVILLERLGGGRACLRANDGIVAASSAVATGRSNRWIGATRTLRSSPPLLRLAVTRPSASIVSAEVDRTATHVLPAGASPLGRFRPIDSRHSSRQLGTSRSSRPIHSPPRFDKTLGPPSRFPSPALGAVAHGPATPDGPACFLQGTVRF